jgi:quinol monooxygenase YgiN
MSKPVTILVFLALLAIASAAGAQVPPSSQPAPAGPVFRVTYFDVAPAASRHAGALLRRFAVNTRKAAGNVEFLALREIGRPGRFATVEAWHDGAAFDAHGAATTAIEEQLHPVLATPFDARRFLPLAVAAPGQAAVPGGAVYVLTHVDVFPAGKDQVVGLVRRLADDSRNDAGALRFDAVVWEGHPNHFHLIEAWSGRAAREAHAIAAHTRQFRTLLAPFEGALYDERVYEPVR